MTATPPLRVLFCLATTALSGGVRMVFEIATRLRGRGHLVEILALSGAPRWYDLDVPLVAARDFEAIDPGRFDVVVVTNAFMVPLLWRRVAPARLAFYAQDYESFHHGPQATYESFTAESPAIRDVYALPVPIVAGSRAVRDLIRERAGRDAWYAPYGLNHGLFHERPRRDRHGPGRILLVGNYLFPYKGIRDGLDAVGRLAPNLDVEAVLVTQETRERQILDAYSFPIELHLRPPEAALPAIYASADVYCCASWYEGFGLPGIEAFALGVPVVSTDTYGVRDYGIDGDNLLLARAHDAGDIAAKLRRVLSEPALAARLRGGGLATVAGGFDWDAGVACFEDALRAIVAGSVPAPPADVLDGMLARLEEDGCFTPVATFRRHGCLRDAVDEVCATLARGRDVAALTRAAQLRDQLAPFVRNPRAQYYRAFRSQYDLCQLVLAWQDDPRLAALLAARRTRRSTHAPNPASALRETRYLE